MIKIPIEGKIALSILFSMLIMVGVMISEIGGNKMFNFLNKVLLPIMLFLVCISMIILIWRYQ